jgi:predicted ester cyclase
VTHNSELVHRLHRTLLESRDLGTIDGFFAEAFVSHNKPPGLPAGAAGVKQFFAIFREAFPDAEVAVDELVAEGDWVAVATTLTGTHRGELMGVAPTGRRVSVTGIDMVRIENERIVEHRGLTDTVGLIRQLSAGIDAESAAT